MDHQKQKWKRRRRRYRRVRGKVTGTTERPRLSVYRSLSNIYAQVIDDGAGRTLAAASSLSLELREADAGGGNVKGAEAVGRLIAEKAKAAGVEQVSFDRGSYKYHGRIRALAAAARESGLKF